MSSFPNEKTVHMLGGASIADVSEDHENFLKPDDEDEDEDVDFNPFLKETLSSDASSSLSSEVDGFDADVDGGETSSNLGGTKLSEQNLSTCPNGMFMQTTVSSEGASLTESGENQNLKKRKSGSVFTSGDQTVLGEGSRGGADVDDVLGEKMNGALNLSKPIVNGNNEDAICKRTRARYSLASFTLDELETFLQETDDDEDIQTVVVDVDDEKEYRKFLSAVLQGGNGNDQANQDNDNIDDDDEENDADFEIELEEALESASDDDIGDKTLEMDDEGVGRRPETRQNRRQRDSVQLKKNSSGQERVMHMRPLVPILPNGVVSPFIALDGKTASSNAATNSLFSSLENGSINGFTPYQIGQLHCLIHEHLQLLIQVYSLCALDSSRGQVASQVRELILEMVKARDQVVKWRNVSYPSIFFQPPYICPSVSIELPQNYTAPRSSGASSTVGVHAVCSSPNRVMHSSDYSLPNSGRSNDCDGQIGSFQSVEGSLWVPFISSPVQTVLDVAPVNLAGKYMDDISAAVVEYRRRQIKQSSDAITEREPMFPFASITSCAEVSNGASTTSQSSTTQQPPRKTLAATLVENAKKQSIAFVPKEIAKLAQRFLPLFNPALFPHKPPPAAVASRVLFTDAEDELLAAGIMEYNSDWKVIQQRFLPCKSTHQIFVRQKNRSSSKAPDNPIKAVRKMKNSPLSVEEIERIQEGLKVFRNDWMAIWRFIVPYRDPSLLPRQWRTALGIQKSYKLDAAKKEKRRLYEANRRKCKVTYLPSWKKQSDNKDNHQDEIAEENMSGGEDVDNADEAYVHEGFLADWRPGTSNFLSEQPSSILGMKNLHYDKLSNGTKIQLHTSNMQQVPFASKYMQHSHVLSHFTQVGCFAPSTSGHVYSVSDKSLTNPKSPQNLRPYRTPGSNNHHLVKLAPDLPPVNLPPSVRIISQTSYNINRLEASSMDSNAADGETLNVNTQLSLAKMGTGGSVKAIQNNCAVQKYPEHPQVSGEKCYSEDRETDSDLQMHPLLFQPSEDRCVPYYPFQNNSSGSSSGFSFFSGNQPQLNLSLFHNPQQASHFVARLNKSLKAASSPSKSCGVDFHPLLQSTEGVNYDLSRSCPPAQLTTANPVEISTQPSTYSDAVLTDRVEKASGARSCSPSKKSNELDLDIHLSSTSRRKNAGEMRDARSMTTVSAVVNGPDHETAVEASSACCPQSKKDESCPSSSNVSGSPAVNYQGNDLGRYSSEDIGDNSHPGIVMEQEELSDSDEDIEEDVEFECEEMDDSEGEEDIGCDQITEMQEKVANFASKEVATGVNFNDQQCDDRSHTNPQGSDCTPTTFIAAFDLGVTSGGKDGTASSWLSLDSSAVRALSHAKPNLDGSTVDQGEVSAAKDIDSSRATRSSKKTTLSTRMVNKDKKSVYASEQLSLGSLSFSASKRPQKPPRKRP